MSGFLTGLVLRGAGARAARPPTPRASLPPELGAPLAAPGAPFERGELPHEGRPNPLATPSSTAGLGTESHGGTAEPPRLLPRSWLPPESPSFAPDPTRATTSALLTADPVRPRLDRLPGDDASQPSASSGVQGDGTLRPGAVEAASVASADTTSAGPTGASALASARPTVARLQPRPDAAAELAREPGARAGLPDQPDQPAGSPPVTAPARPRAVRAPAPGLARPPEPGRVVAPPGQPAQATRIEVRIGRIEVRIVPPPPRVQQAPAPVRDSHPADDHALARRYLDRRWY